MEFHELSTLFPSFEGTMEFEALCSAMKSDGFDPKYPILTWKGEIIDGRHRYLASQQANITPIYRKLSDEASLETALDEVTKANFFRRSMTTAEKAIVAEKMANLAHGGNRTSEQGANRPLAAVSMADAANKMQVSPKSVKRVRELKNNHPETYEQLEKGEIKTINAAVNQAKKPIKEMIDDGDLVPIPSELPPHGYFISENYVPNSAAATVVSGVASLYCHGNETSVSLRKYIIDKIVTNTSEAMKDYEINSLLHFKNVLDEIYPELNDLLNNNETKH